MPDWTRVEMPYRPRDGESDTFARARTGFAAGSLGKIALAPESARQSRFESELAVIAEHLGSSTIPVFVDFAGERRRMDKGCVGHAVARRFIEPVVDGVGGVVVAVTLASRR